MQNTKHETARIRVASGKANLPLFAALKTANEECEAWGCEPWVTSIDISGIPG